MIRSVLGVCTFLGFLLPMAFSHLPASGQGEEIPIHLRTGSFDPLRDARGLQARDQARGTKLFLVQMRGPVLPHWKEALRELCEVLWYLPEYTFLVKAEDPSARERIKNLPFVRWVGPYLPRYRVHPRLLRESGEMTVRVVFIENSLICRIRSSELLTLASLDGVLWIEPYARPKVFNENARWVIQSGTYHFAPIHENGLRGENQLITVADTGIRATHEMFSDTENVGIGHRKIRAYYVPRGAGGAPGDEANHGTPVAGTVAGDAGTRWVYDISKHDGQAFAARLIVQDIDNDSDPYIYPPSDYFEMFEPAYDAGSLIHTNSWGGGEGYTWESRRIDNFLWLHKDFTILYAAGNSGPSPRTLSAEAEAKNVIIVGATGNGVFSNNLPGYSSRGPTQDNRIKPTVVAPGEGVWSADSRGDTMYSPRGGTSMSTPVVAGAVALIRQYYEEGWYPSGRRNPADAFEPSSALIRATLLAGTVEVNGENAYYNGHSYPNWDQGWGRVNLSRSLYFEGDGKRLWLVDERKGVRTGENAVYFINVTDNTQPLKFVLCWTDYPGAPGASVQLVNDLDLRVTAPNGEVYLGNVFAGYNPGFSITGGSADRRNTEEVVILLPENNKFPTGSYRVEVRGHNVPMGEPGTNAQPFALVVVGGISPEKWVLPTFTWTQTSWEGGPRGLEVGRFNRSYAWFHSSENLSWENAGRITLPAGKTSGWMESCIFDSHRVVDWKEVRLIAEQREGIVVKLRTGMDSDPYDGGWTDWVVHRNGEENENLPQGRYLQYRLELFGNPTVYEISVTYVPILPAPSFLYPTCGANVGESRPTIGWTRVESPSPPILYRLRIDNDPDFSSAEVDSGWMENTTWELASPLPDGIWHACVQARDNAGFLSENVIWFRVDTLGPPPPLPSSPPDRTSTREVPTLVWQDVTENSLPVLYLVSMSDSSGFPHENLRSGWIKGTQWKPPELGDGLWYWRVKAKDNAGNEGEWSGSRSFRMDRVPPDPPVPLSPSNNAAMTTNTPTLKWGEVWENSLPVGYFVSVSDDPSFQRESRNSGWIPSTAWSTTLPDGTWFWRVRARDAAGNESAWSQIFSLRLDTTPPPTPSPLSPPENGISPSGSPLFQWSGVSDFSPPVSYLLQISDLDTFTCENRTSGWTAHTGWRVHPPLPDGIWFWRVKARDALGNESPWSRAVRIVVDNTPPERPTILSQTHAEGVPTSNRNASFQWSAVGGPSPVLYLYRLENYENEWGETTGTELFYENLPDGNFVFRLRAKDAGGESEEGRYSIIVDTVPPILELPAPSENRLRLHSPSKVFLLRGKTEPGSRIEIDNLRIEADEDGMFGVELPLSTGSNFFLLRIIDRAGNVTERQLIVEWSEPSPLRRYGRFLIGLVLVVALFAALKLWLRRPV